MNSFSKTVLSVALLTGTCMHASMQSFLAHRGAVAAQKAQEFGACAMEANAKLAKVVVPFAQTVGSFMVLGFAGLLVASCVMRLKYERKRAAYSKKLELERQQQGTDETTCSTCGLVQTTPCYSC